MASTFSQIRLLYIERVQQYVKGLIFAMGHPEGRHGCCLSIRSLSSSSGSQLKARRVKKAVPVLRKETVSQRLPISTIINIIKTFSLHKNRERTWVLTKRQLVPMTK